MNWFTRIWNSSIGKKFLVAVTGLALLGFMFGHIFGNLHLYWGAQPFNEYADGLHQMKVLLPVAEIGILIAFVAHIVLVVRITLENRKAASVGYKVKGTKNPGFKYTASTMMLLSGLVVLLFLVVHILDYRLGRAADDIAFANCMHAGLQCDETVGALVVSKLQVPWRAALYALGSLFIGWHLVHGIRSAVRSIGFASNKWTPVIEKAGAAIGITLGVLFASIPIAILLTGGSFAKLDELGAVSNPGPTAVDPTVDNHATGVQIEALDDQADLGNTDEAGVLPEDD